MTRLARVTSLLLGLALALPTHQVAAEGVAQQRQKLHELLDEFRQTRSELSAVKRDERATTRLLSDLDSARYRAQRELRRLDKQVQDQQARVDSLKGKVAVDVDSVQAMQQRVRARLRALGRLGSHGHLRVLLSAVSLDDLAIRRVLLRRVAAHDAALLKDLSTGEVELAKDRAALVDRLRELQEARDDARATLEELKASREQRAQALLNLGSKRGALETRVEQMRQSEKKLRTLIWRKTAPKHEAVGLARLRGQLPWPLVARVDRQAGGGSHGNGLTLRAALGTRVRAIAEGTVVHSGFLRGYGVLVIIDHGHGFHTLCAHLARTKVERGQQVKAGDIVGFVGDSESLDGAKLYFELRRGGRPVSPERWLSKKPKLAH